MSSTIIFLHIPKSAGTTLHRIIDRQYRQDEDIFVYRPRKFLEETSFDRRQKARMVRGHLWYGLHEEIPNPSTYMTILRDPVKRVLSLYKHALWDPHHTMHQIANQHTLGELIEQQHHKESFDNAQLRMVTGIWDAVPFGGCTTAHLDQAKILLQERFSIVGTMAQFDETLLLMQEAYRWRYLYYTKHNTGKTTPTPRTTPDPHTLTLIESCNQLDHQLYQFAHTLCQTEIDKRGPAFQQKLTRFRRRNRWLSPFHRLYWQLTKISIRQLISPKT